MSDEGRIPRRGRVAEPLLLEITAELSPSDLDRLSAAPKTNPPVLQKLRAVHHRQAQLLAQGKTHGEIAAIVGCTTQRIVQLLVDPAFISLVEYYKDQLMVQMLSDGARLQDKITDVGEMAVDELRERLEDDNNRRRLPIGEVRKIAEFAMDRTVAPMKTAQTTQQPPTAVTINFGTTLRTPPGAADGMSARSEPQPPTIEGEALDNMSARSEPPAPLVPLRTGSPNVPVLRTEPEPDPPSAKEQEGNK